MTKVNTGFRIVVAKDVSIYRDAGKVEKRKTRTDREGLGIGGGRQEG